jgi:hypothetical protein
MTARTDIQRFVFLQNSGKGLIWQGVSLWKCVYPVGGWAKGGGGLVRDRMGRKVFGGGDGTLEAGGEDWIAEADRLPVGC